ncbi:MAG: NAD(P)-dependent dehydrogenase (short-subunit alcohol dehydrogenase family) [Litorivivens sp.]|jgi:NAD(P)-dependent dehydrogenase (short-subunit alcohol dehydrogenase family)|tara:strand:+ start:2378 stop:3280 length:903 start_codon:yes stop_codon:yes gene_type:complete
MNIEFKDWIKRNLKSQTGKTVLITGANSGIGFYAALALASAGAHVIMAGRNEDKIKAAIKLIETEHISGTVEAGIVNLASLESVRIFADVVKNKHTRLDILINNAGVMMTPESKTDDGFELQFGVNFLSHFALTGLLYELLNTTPDSRVVTLSSLAHRGASIDFNNFKIEKPYDARKEYYQSKLANIMFALELGKRLNSDKVSIRSVACHPGFTKTDLQRHIDPKMLAGMTFMEAWQGSLSTIVAATKADVQQGEYYGPDGQNEMGGFPALAIIDAAALDDEVANRLWSEAQVYTGVSFP